MEKIRLLPEEVKKILDNAPKDEEITGEKTAYFFKLSKERDEHRNR